MPRPSATPTRHPSPRHRPRAFLDLTGSTTTGVGRVFDALARRLGAPDGGFDLVTLVRATSPPPPGLDGGEAVAVSGSADSPRTRLRDWRAARRVRGVDVSFLPSFLSPAAPGSIRLLAFHDFVLLDDPRPSPRRFALRRLAAWQLARADRIVCSSEATARELVRRAPATAGRIVVIGCGVDVDRWRARADGAARADARRGEGATPFLLCVSNKRPHKNLPLLLEVLDMLERRGRPLRLLTAGDARPIDEAAWSAAIAAWSARSGLATRVENRGRTSDEELAALYAGCAVLVSPSLDEGFGLVPLEAMACGAPVVAARAGALPATVGDAAILCDPRDPVAWADAVSDLLDSPARRAALAQAARRQLERHDVGRSAAAWGALAVERLASRRGPRRGPDAAASAHPALAPDPDPHPVADPGARHRP